MSSTEQTEHDAAELPREDGGELITRDPVLETILSDTFGAVIGPELNNFHGDPTDKWRLTALATGPMVKSFDDTVGKIINIQYFYVHTVNVDGPTPGEFINAVRVVLIEPDLTAYGFVSNVLAQDLSRMIRTFGLRPWNPPVHVHVTKTPAKRGYFYNLVPAN